MGCFNFTGFISDMNIKSGDECVLIPLYKTKKNKKVQTYSNHRDYGLDEGIFQYSMIRQWVPFCLPIFGDYNEYGNLENINYDKKELKYLEKMLDVEDIFVFLDSIQEGNLTEDAKKSKVLKKLFNLFDFTYVIEHKDVYNHLLNTNKELYSNETWFKPQNLLNINFELVETSSVELKNDIYTTILSNTPFFNKISQKDLNKFYKNQLSQYDIYRLKNQTSDLFYFVGKIPDKYEHSGFKSYSYIFNGKHLDNYNSTYRLKDFKKFWEKLGGESIDLSYYNTSIYDEDYKRVYEAFSTYFSNDLLSLTKFKTKEDFIFELFNRTFLTETEKYKTIEFENILNQNFLDENGKFIKFDNPLILNESKELQENLHKLYLLCHEYNFNFSKEQSKSPLAFETSSLYLNAIINNKLKKEISGFNQFLHNMRLVNKTFQIPLACTQFGEDKLEYDLIKVYSKIAKKHKKEYGDNDEDED